MFASMNILHYTHLHTHLTLHTFTQYVFIHGLLFAIADFCVYKWAFTGECNMPFCKCFFRSLSILSVLPLHTEWANVCWIKLSLCVVWNSYVSRVESASYTVTKCLNCMLDLHFTACVNKKNSKFQVSVYCHRSVWMDHILIVYESGLILWITSIVVSIFNWILLKRKCLL